MFLDAVPSKCQQRTENLVKIHDLKPLIHKKCFSMSMFSIY